MKMNKFILKAIACVAAIAAIGSVSFAYFTDRAYTESSGISGTLSIDANVDTEGKIIIFPGKTYDISTSVRNTGSKSADIRVEVTLNTDNYTLRNYAKFLIDGQPVKGESGVIGNVRYEKASYDTYYFESTVNGSVEKEDGVDTNTFSPNIQLCFTEECLNSGASFLETRIDVYAKQHRNTNDETWSLVDFN